MPSRKKTSRNVSSPEWPEFVQKEFFLYRKKILLFTLVPAILIPVSFIISDLVHGVSAYLLNYSIPLGLLLIYGIFLTRSKKLAAYIHIHILGILIGLGLTLFLPNARASYLILLVCFPLIAFQLTGIRRGLVWTGILFLLFLILMLGVQLSLVPRWTVGLSPIELTQLLISCSLISAMTLFSETRHDKLNGRIITQMTTDDVTSLPNRRRLNDTLEEDHEYLFAIIAIQNFNELGILFGYDLSDNILKHVAAELKSRGEKHLFSMFRLKGNEFGILLDLEIKRPHSPEHLIQSLLNQIQKNPLSLGPLELRLYLQSGGVKFCMKPGFDFISRADAALKRSIRLHRTFTLHEEDSDEKEAALHSLNHYTVLLKNQENRTFKAYFQPIVDSKTGKIVWYEALLRIKNHNGHYESPYPYLNIAETTGLDSELTDFMVREACEAIRKTGKDVSVNIFLRDMLRPELLEHILEYLKDLPKDGGRLILEILEREDLNELERCHGFLEKTKQHRCLVAIDDFGSGYSNFSNLLKLPIDIVKIDGALIRQMGSNVRAERMVEGIIGFCRQVGYSVVAEHVENEALFRQLQSRETDFLQGYYIGEPMELSF